MKSLTLIFILFPASWLFAQKANKITAKTPHKYDSMRSIYIKTYTDHFFVWPVLKQRRLDYEISDLPEKNKRLLYKSNSPYSLGLGAYVFEVALEFAVAIPLDEKSKEIYGPSDARDIQVTLFTKKWGLDMFRQKYTGFYIDDPSIKKPDNSPISATARHRIQEYRGNVELYFQSQKVFPALNKQFCRPTNQEGGITYSFYNDCWF